MTTDSVRARHLDGRTAQALGVAHHATTFSPAEMPAGLRALLGFLPGFDEHLVPTVESRPLGAFSTSVVADLGNWIADVQSGAASVTEMLRAFETRAAEVPNDLLSSIVAKGGDDLHVARLDTVFVERALAVLHSQCGVSEWRSLRSATRTWEVARRLARAEGSHPLLAWSDIASRHPVLDPRSFLAPGTSRDHEVYMYRCQWAIDQGQRLIVQRIAAGETSTQDLQAMVEISELIVRLMGHLRRVRSAGEFDRLDTFLSPNGEVRGHATGSFSVWVYLAGWLTRAKPEYADRLLDATDLIAYDSDAHCYIQRLREGTLLPLATTANPDLVRRVQHFQKGFHAGHHTAVKQHAPGSMTHPAPWNLDITNEESMRRAAE